VAANISNGGTQLRKSMKLCIRLKDSGRNAPVPASLNQVILRSCHLIPSKAALHQALAPDAPAPPQLYELLTQDVKFGELPDIPWDRKLCDYVNRSQL
jgi:hypothetical protein